MDDLVVAFSGGKDSTALVLQLHERGERFRLLHTATGNELPPVRTHIERVSHLIGRAVLDLAAPTLSDLIEEQNCLPNWRMRWCTRMIKIEPMAEWLRRNPSTLAVGLRADEEGRAGGTYDSDVIYPLRDWGWDEAKVLAYLDALEIVVPARTDCAVCFYQTLHEWWLLWRDYPAEYAQGEAWETMTGHTFRSPSRDNHAASMAGLRREFETGYVPQPRRRKIMCRVCST